MSFQKEFHVKWVDVEGPVEKESVNIQVQEYPGEGEEVDLYGPEYGANLSLSQIVSERKTRDMYFLRELFLSPTSPLAF